MNEASIEKAITKMEREVLALKTSHNIGAGTIRFYESSITIGEPVSELSIKIADSEPFPPFLLVVRPDSVVGVVIFDADTRTGRYYLGGVTGTVVIVSSSLIEYIRRV